MGLDFKTLSVSWDEDKRKSGKACCSSVSALVMRTKPNRPELERLNRRIHNTV
jgi:hypothetical protein